MLVKVLTVAQWYLLVPAKYCVCWLYMFTVSSGVEILRGLYSCCCILSRSPHSWIQWTYMASTHSN